MTNAGVGAAANDLLLVSGLETHFPFGSRWFSRHRWVRAVDGVDVHVGRGEILGLVGESGCGKTTLGRSILRLVEPTAGTVRFDGIDVLALDGRDLRAVRRRMQIIFQDPYASLSPRRQIKEIIAEPLLLHRLAAKSDIEGRVAGLLGDVGLEPYFMYRYPHEMSGGQRQRIAIARALSLDPQFIVADEPVSALDVSVRAQILNILLELQRKKGIALLFISHDLAVVERIADRIAVMYAGKIVEEGDASRLMTSPLHPYTQVLLSSVPAVDRRQRRGRIRLTGEPPSLVQPIAGCLFAARCPEVREICRQVAPALDMKSAGHRAACHLR